MGFRVGLGISVTRPTEVLGNPAGADPSPRDIFTITGFVLITQLVGIVTVAMDATGSTLRLQHDDGPTFLCAALAAIADDGINTMYTISGDVADLMYKLELGAAAVGRGGFNGGIAAGAGVIAKGMLAAPGTIEVLWTGDQDGSIQWELCYIPITDQGLVVIA